MKSPETAPKLTTSTRIMRTMVVTLFLASAAVAHGTTYYACDCGVGADTACAHGSDTATGTSPDSAWQTLSKARQFFTSQMKPGDTIELCRGGSFTADGGAWVNDSCRANAPCTVTDYLPSWGAPNEARAIVVTPAGGKAFSFANSGNARHEEGYVISNLDVRGTNGTGIGFFAFNDISDVLLDNLEISGLSVGVLVQGSNAPGPGSDGRNRRITLQNSRIHDNSGQGFEGSCDGCAVVNNNFDNNGFLGASKYHNLFWDEATNSTGGLISGNTLTRSGVVNGKCTSVSLVAHGKHAGLTIQNNTIKEQFGSATEPCWGIAVDTGGIIAEGFTGLKITGNTVSNMGNIGIGVNACVDCLIEGNTVSQSQPFGTTGISIPDRSRKAIDLPMDRVTVTNNSITIANKYPLTAIALGGEGSGHIVTGNSVAYTGTVAGWNCFSYPLPLGAYSTIDNNTCQFTAGKGAWEKTTKNLLPNWQTYSGFDLHSITQ
jgi:parallel beta-helix repeat protein